MYFPYWSITMETGTMTFQGAKTLEDPLSYLPCSTILDFKKKQVIFTQGQPSTSIYLVISGKVKICRACEGLSEVVLDIYQADEFFGESALIGLSRGETAVALEATQAMFWTTSEIERIAGERPKLAIALLQLVVQRSEEFGSRIESFATDSIQRRLALALIRFSDRFGHPRGDGAVQMMPLTHDLLSVYMGTSREIITNFMNKFRRQGYLRYSRREMVVHVDALKEWMKQQSEGKMRTRATLAPAYISAAAA
jgi:CRP/FNR family transcriptional regulator, cyclic AMP receptor protein